MASLFRELFVYVQLPQHDRAALSRRALVSRSREHEIREQLREVVVAFVDGIDARGRELSEQATKYIIAVADLATWVRSGVEGDTFTTREILASAEPEAPARFAKQIAAVASALQAMGHGEGLLPGSVPGTPRIRAFVGLRATLGRKILLGLEVLVVADIIRTIVVDPTLDSALSLGLIVLVRIALSFAIDIEIDGVAPWRKRGRETEADPAG